MKPTPLTWFVRKLALEVKTEIYELYENFQASILKNRPQEIRDSLTNDMLKLLEKEGLPVKEIPAIKLHFVISTICTEEGLRRCLKGKKNAPNPH